jgi:glycosyltransferase involved in cell wall biosynthesis
MNPTSSIVMSTYNWPEALELNLMALANQSVLPGEILIADDGSTSETRRLIESIQKRIAIPVIHLWHENEGFRKTIIMNQAFVKASGDYIIQLDGDVIPHRHFVKDHLEFAVSGSFVAGTRVTTNKELASALIREKRTNVSVWDKGTKNFFNGLHFPSIGKLLENYRTGERNIYYAKGCNMAFWKTDLQKVNGYDESFTGWGYEDSDLAIRLYNAGIRKRYLKLAGIVFHLWHQEYSRDRINHNNELLRHTKESGKTWAEKGMNQYQATQ